MSEEAKKAKKASDEPGSYRPADKEVDAVKRMLERRKKEKSLPRYKISYEGGKPRLEADHPDAVCTHVKLADMLCTGDSILAEGLIVQLANASQWGDRLTADDVNVMVATVGAIAPRDATEALLACQMAAIHKATMIAVRRLNRSETLQQIDSASNTANKLARTYAAQMEALKRYRSSGEQRIRVQYVTVNEGGRAIVGDVTKGGGTPENASQSHALGAPAATGGANARGPALLRHEQAVRMSVPSAGREGEARLPHARRAGGSAKGES